MAISVIEYQLISVLRQRGHLPPGGDLLEIGEANWYGDISLDILRHDIARLAAPEQRAGLLAELETAARAGQEPAALWDLAKIFWRTFVQPASISVIDFHGSAIAQKLDLNQPVDLGRQFHLVHNNGTLEHIFDIGQAFRNMHDLTMVGGLMIHHAPFTGWVDHGFYSLQPTLFWDLAAVNGYEMIALIYAEMDPPLLQTLESREALVAMARDNQIARNANLAAVLRRTSPAPFKVPMQGIYADRLSPTAVAGWEKQRGG